MITPHAQLRNRIRPAQRAALVLLFVLASCTPLRLSAQSEAPPEASFAVTSFVIDGENPLDGTQTTALLAPYTGNALGLEDLQRAAEALETELRTRGYIFHRVIIPPQRAGAGVFTLRVLAFRLGRVQVRGNNNFSEENILRSLPGLRPEQVPDTRVLARALRIAGQHPSKQIQVTMRESDLPDRLDAQVDVTDTRPWTVFSSLSNTGSPETGRYRLSVGAQHSNLFDRDQSATLTYTTSPGHLKDVTQIGAFYSIPLYQLGATIDSSFVYSDVDSGTVADVFQVSGSGRFFGLHYNQALGRSDHYQQTVSLGIEDRSFTDNVDFLGSPLGGDVRSRPLSLGYQGRWPRNWGSASLWVKYVRNLPGGSNNDGAAYRAQRAGASRNWDLLRYGASLDYFAAGGWRLNARARGQRAKQPLISGEQFGVGGADSVRGFEEREIAGDDGIQLTLEVTTPAFGPGLRLLAFADAGRVKLANAQPGDLVRANVLSLGLGLRWQLRSNYGLSLDFAHVLKGAASTRDGEEKLHFSFFMRL